MEPACRAATFYLSQKSSFPFPTAYILEPFGHRRAHAKDEVVVLARKGQVSMKDDGKRLLNRGPTYAPKMHPRPSDTPVDTLDAR